MTVRALPLLVLICASPAAAGPVAAGSPSGSPCGGDAFSSARVVEHRPPLRGPLTAVPDTLCADLAPQGPAAAVRIEAYPLVAPQVGGGGAGVPYGRGPRPDRP